MPNGKFKFATPETLEQVTGPQRVEGADPLLGEEPQEPPPGIFAFEPIEVEPTEARGLLPGVRPKFGFTAGGAFEVGLKRGLLTPLEVVLGSPEEVDTGHPVSELLGELGGILVSFIPFIKGSQMTVKGIGLTSGFLKTSTLFSRYPAFANVIEQSTIRAAEGALAFGAFEAGAGPIEQLPQRAILGATIGATLEGILFGSALAFRGSQARRLIRKGRLDPDALAIERQIHPGAWVEDRGRMIRTLTELGDPDKQLEAAVGVIANIFEPEGRVIIPGLTNPRRVAQALRVQRAGTNFVIGPERRGVFELLVTDRRPMSRLVRRLAQMRGPEFLGEVGPRAVLSPEEAVALLKADTRWERGIETFTRTRQELLDEYSAGKGAVEGDSEVLGRVVYDNSKLQGLFSDVLAKTEAGTTAQIRLATDVADLQFMETVVHELTHHSVARRAARLALELAPEERVARLSYTERVARWPSKIRIEDVFDITENAGPIIEEFQAATEELLVRYGARRKVIQKAMAEDAYWTGHHELMARMAEFMYLDPKAARELAPRAFDLMGRMIDEEFPRLRMLLARGETINVGEWIAAGVRELPEVRVTREIFEPLMPKLTGKMQDQFAKTGFFQGQEVFVNGLAKEVLSIGKDTLLVRDLGTLAIETLPMSRVSRRLFTDVVARQAAMDVAIRGAIAQPPKWVGVLLEDELTGGVKKAVVELENYELIRGGDEGLTTWLRSRPEFRLMGEESPIRRALKAAAGEDKAGILLEDNGLYTAYVVDRGSVRVTAETIYEGIGGTPIAPVGSDVLPLSLDTVLESLLREAGATERELPVLLKRARDLVGKDLLELVDRDVRDALDRGIKEVAGKLDDAETAAQRANTKLEKLEDGRFRLIDPQTNAEIGTFATEAEAIEFANTMSVDQAGVELVTGQISSESLIPRFGGGGPPPKPQSTQVGVPSPEQAKSVGWLQRALDAVNLFAPLFTSLESFSKSAERAGFGPAFSKIFEPAQKAILEVHRVIGEVAREGLGGRTYGQAIRDIQTATAKVAKDRYEVVRGWIEAMSREEIEAVGGLLKRGMTRQEIDSARAIVKVGLGNDVPRLLATLRMAQNLLKNKKTFTRRVDRFGRQQLTPEFRETLDRLIEMSKDIPEDLAGVMEQLGMSKEERFVMRILEEGLKRPKDEFSTFAVSRWASARPLGKGYRTGRAEWAAEQRMTSQELRLGEEMDKLFEVAFEDSGMKAKRQLGGYWPHMRMWAEQGFAPDMDFMRAILPNESIEWSALRFRSGELDIYEVDPVLTAYKHTRNLVMKQQFDPVLPEIRRALRPMRREHPRVYRIMNQYIEELMGRPHVSFERLNAAIAASLKVLGHEAPERFAETIINNLVALGYGATIPFRPALTLRNYYQMVQMIPPRIGFKWYFRGLERALTKEGFLEATRSGAVPVGVTPVFAATEALTPETLRFLDIRLRRLFEKGFDWYRKADDVGRAAAFHGFKARAKRYLPDYMQGRITWEQFKARAKINTFDSVDIAEFERAFKAGNIEEALDQLGVILARESHFRYGHANHPAGWGSVYGRMFGQFGTWPVQYKDYLLQGLARGSTADKVNFLASHVAINMSLVTAGAMVGMNLWSWVSFPSLNYTGGPLADIMIDGVRAINGSPAERAMARRSLLMQFPTLDDPRSIFVPGSYFIGDIKSALDVGGGGSILEAGGFRLMEPGESSGLEWLIGTG